MNSTLDFAEAYGAEKSGEYSGNSRSLLDAEAQQKLNENLSDASAAGSKAAQDAGLPACHLDFSALGNLNFSWMEFKAAPINYKLFIKLRRIGDEIRKINDVLISLIEEFKCCNTAEYYNEKVVDGIFRYIIEDFLGSLVDTVEGLIKSAHIIKAILCSVRPVPGNPWLGQGGYDWVNTVYSVITGFEGIIDWVLDGNPLDVFLKPISNFRKKLESCKPLIEDDIDEDPVRIRDQMLKKLLTNYNDTTNVATDDQIEAYADVTDELKDANVTQIESYKKISQIETARRIIRSNTEIKPEQKELDLIKNASEFKIATDQLRIDQKKFKTAFAKKELAKKPIEKAANKSLNQKFTSASIIQKTLDQLILDKYDPGCTCLAGIFTISMYNPFEFVTVSTYSDIRIKLAKRVHWNDIGNWHDLVEQIEDGDADDIDSSLIADLYITKNNLEKKYKSNNTSIDRNNIKNLKLWSNALFNHDYDTAVLNYEMINFNGAYVTEEYNMTTEVGIYGTYKLFKELANEERNVLYSDDIDKNKTNINKQVFEVNKRRMIEKGRVSTERSILQQERTYIENGLNRIWNTLRRNALQQIKYQQFNKATNNTSYVNKAILKTFNMLDNTYDYIYAQTTLNRLGPSYDLVKFLQNFNSTTPSEMNALMDPLGSLFNEDFKPEALYQVYDESDNNRFVGNFADLKNQWVIVNEKISILDSAINKLDILVEMNNVVIQVLGTQLTECGCDMLCKLIQYIVDLIISTAKGLVKLIITKLIQAITNEHVSYIMKVIIDKYKCYLDIAAYDDNVTELEAKSESLKLMFDTGTVDEPGENPLNYMHFESYCKEEEKTMNTEEKQITDDEINATLDEESITKDEITISNPQPTFGENDGPASPGNIIINHGGTTKEQTSNRKIPKIILECSNDKKPSIEIVLEKIPSYEFMVMFKPSTYILSAEVTSTPQSQNINSQKVTDANGKVIDTLEIKKDLDDIKSIMDKVQKQLASSHKTVLYIEPDCDEDDINQEEILTLCSMKNLVIYNFNFLVNDEFPADDNPTKLAYGELSGPFNSDGTIVESFMTEEKLIPETEDYYIYKIPEDTTVASTLPDETVTYDGSVDSNQNNRVENVQLFEIVDFKKITKNLTITYTYTTVDNVITATRLTQTAVSTVTPFRFPNFEFFVEFRNKVNRLKIRLIVDILADHLADVSTNYDVDSYDGKYLDAGEFGTINGSNRTINISAETIFKASKTSLQIAEMVTTKPPDIINKVDLNKELDLCLLPEAHKKLFGETISSVVGKEETVSKFEEDVNSLVDEMDLKNPIETKVNVITKIPDLKYSIPLLLLNKEKNIMIQIVDRKIYFQFPSSSVVNSEPIVIDHQLDVDAVYMLVFNYSGLLFNISLITEDKKIISAKGINIDGYDLFPTIIGGNNNGTASFCGTILDVITSKSGRKTLSYYKRSNLSYVPKTSSIVFDFSLFDGGLVRNVANRVGLGYAKEINELDDRFNAPTKLSNQIATGTGKVVSLPKFYQCFDGYVDNFFCKDNLIGKDFTISIWAYSKNNAGTRHILIADDINNIFVYYDAFAHKIVMDVQGTKEIVYITLDYWTQITFKHSLLSNNYHLTVHKLAHGNIAETRTNLVIKHKAQFALMSIFAEYDHKTRLYGNRFNGLLSTITIFMNTIDESIYMDMHNNQKIMVKGMEDVY